MTRRGLLLRLAAVPMPILLGAACGSPGSPTPTAVPPTQAPAVIAPTAAAPAQPTAAAPAPPTAAAPAPPQVLPPTPACSDADEPTIAQTEGPYFTRNSPERSTLLEPSARGEKLTLTGHVLSTTCQPVPRALLDFWQADDTGQYDNSGYRYRGHQFADEQGRFTLETVIPALYPGRTRHLHVKVQAPNRPVLTTQLYFPNEAANRTDRIYRAELEMQLQNSEAGKLGAFTFVVNAG